MKQKPFTAAQFKALSKNAEHANRTGDSAPPVVKFFAPWNACTWLISELEDDGDTMFGLCDLGQGFPELGRVSLAELRDLRGPFGLTIERDTHFTADKSMGEYADAAYKAGRIIA